MVVRAPILGHIIWLSYVFAPIALAAATAYFVEPPRFVTIALSVSAYVASRWIYLALIRHTRQQCLQTEIRRKALAIDQPFVLMSRSFDQSQEFRTYAPIPGSPNAYLTLLEALITDISRNHPIVALGDKDLDPDDPAGRAIYMCAWPDKPTRTIVVHDVETSDVMSNLDVSWEAVFVRLAHAAGTVLLIPALSDGVLREIELLKREKLGTKTVVYMWPKRVRRPNALSAPSDAWEAARKSIAERGLKLPAHRPQGGLLRFNEDFTMEDVLELPRRDLLSPVVDDESNSQGTPLRDFMPVIRAYEIASGKKWYVDMWNFISET